MSLKSSSVQAMQCGARSTLSRSPKRCGVVTGSWAKTSMAAPAMRWFLAPDTALFVDDSAAGRVDQKGLGFHQRQLRGTDQVFRLPVQRAVDRDEIRPGEQFIEADQLDPVLFRNPTVDDRVVRQVLVQFDSDVGSGFRAGGLTPCRRAVYSVSASVPSYTALIA